MRSVPATLLVLAFVLPAPVVATSDLAPAERFQNVQQLRQAGDAEGALAELDALRREFPNDVDYALGRAQVLTGLGRDEEALVDLREAVRLAPDYEDAWKLRLRLLSTVDGEAWRDEREEARLDAAERFPDATWWMIEPDRDGWQFTLLVGAGIDDLTNSLPNWNNQFVELEMRENPGRFYVAKLGRSERYGSSDTTLGIGVEQSWENGWFAGAELSSADSAAYLPEIGLRAHAGKALDDGWVVDLALRRSEFATATLGTAVGTLEKYTGAWRYAYGLTGSRLTGASDFFSHQASVTRYFGDSTSVGLSVNAGDEAEVLESGAVIESEVRGVTLSGRYGLNDRFAIRWWLGTQKQGDFYRRRYVGLAVSVRL